MLKLTLFFIFASAICGAWGQKINYSSWRWLELSGDCVDPNSVHTVIDDIEEDTNLSMLDHRNGVLNFLASPDSKFHNISNVTSDHCKIKTVYKDLKNLLANERPHRTKRRIRRDAYFDKYLSNYEIELFYSMIEKKYPNTVKKTVIGRSSEGRDIVMLTVSNDLSQNYECDSPNINFQKSTTHHRNDLRSNKANHWKFPMAQHQYQDIRRIRESFRRRSNVRSRGRRMIRRMKKKTKSVERMPRVKRNAGAETDTHSHIPLNLAQIFGPAANINRKDAKRKKILKPVIFIEAGAHSREWIAPAATLYLVESLAKEPKLSEMVEWRIIPMLNPDGYVFSRDYDRMWRKTRSRTSNPLCFGADINRNFGSHWGEVDTSVNPCKPHFGGSHVFSEPESRAVRDNINGIRHRIKAYISLHNWGQEIMYPYSYTNKRNPWNMEELISHGKQMSSEILKSRKVNYTVGMSSIRLYPASGTAADWAHDHIKVPYTYTIELRDVGKKHFLIPEEEIIPTGEDLLAAMNHLGKVIGEETHSACNEN